METSRTTRPSGPVICPRPTTVVVEGEKINGTTVSVPKGTKLTVELPTQPANGFKWIVTAVPKELDMPTEGARGHDPRAGGSSGATTFTWELASPLLQSGASYAVTITLKRPGAPTGIQTVAFNIKLV